MLYMITERRKNGGRGKINMVSIAVMAGGALVNAWHSLEQITSLES